MSLTLYSDFLEFCFRFISTKRNMNVLFVSGWNVFMYCLRNSRKGEKYKTYRYSIIDQNIIVIQYKQTFEQRKRKHKKSHLSIEHSTVTGVNAIIFLSFFSLHSSNVFLSLSFEFAFVKKEKKQGDHCSYWLMKDKTKPQTTENVFCKTIFACKCVVVI